MPVVRTRIAPSPTGYLHIGTARTALFNYLFAQKHGGAFVLRIEDTDLERSDKKFEEDILESLTWLGLAPDESPINGGPHGPYRQSERVASYGSYLQRLLQEDKAYYCSHSETELDEERTSLLAAGSTPLHRCSERERSGDRGIIRFKTPVGRSLMFPDVIRGDITFASDLIGDFSVAKDLSTPLYNFAVTVDDHEMAISHVIRGEDHISNTPKQLLIQEALGLATPTYAHLPLILGLDRSKLSKRHGATSIREFKEQGYLAEALVNFMAFLGWNPGGERELFTLQELIAAFDLAKVQKSGAVFNIEKLDWMNGAYIRQKTASELAALLRPYLADAAVDEETLERAAVSEQPRLKKLSDFTRQADYYFSPPDYPVELLRWKEMPVEETRTALERARKCIDALDHNDFTAERLEERLLATIGAGDKGAMLWPLRVALSGRTASAGPFEIMAVLGKEATSNRISRAIEKTLAN